MNLVDPEFITSPDRPRPRDGGPTWQVAFLFPPHGHWSESEYLTLDRLDHRRLIELVDGRLDVLASPDFRHQSLVGWLSRQLDDHVSERGLGTALFAPLPVHLGRDHYREPDIIFMRPEQIS